MKVLLICDYFPTYGTRPVLSLAETLERHGHEVIVASNSVGLYSGNLEINPKWKFNLIRFPSMALPGIPYSYTPMAGNHLSSIVRSFQPDIVHAHFISYWLSLSTARIIGQGFPMVLTLHGLTLPKEMPGVFSRLAMRLLYKTFARKLVDSTTAFICVSRMVKKKFSMLYPHVTSPIEVIPNGIIPAELNGTVLHSKEEMQASLGLTGKTTFVFLGRVTQDKGVMELAHAFRRLRSRREDVALLFVGDGGTLPSVRKTLLKTPDAHILGYRADIGTFLSAADVFVLPSYREGFSTALIEAMHFGLPFISTPVGGVKDLQSLGAMGNVVDVQNSLDLYDAMNRYCNAESIELAEWGSKNRAISQQFLTWDNLIDRFLTYYQDVISSDSP